MSGVSSEAMTHPAVAFKQNVPCEALDRYGIHRVI